MTVEKLTKEQEIDQAYQQRKEQEKKQKSDAWELADKELEHQQKQSVWLTTTKRPSGRFLFIAD